MAQARVCDNTRAKGNVVGPLVGIPVLVAVKQGTYELMKPDRKGIGEGGERPFSTGLVARKAATYELMEPDQKWIKGGERPFLGGRGLVLGFLDETVLEEVVKWERLEEGATVIETSVVEGLAVVVRDVEGGT